MEEIMLSTMFVVRLVLPLAITFWLAGRLRTWDARRSA